MILFLSIAVIYIICRKDDADRQHIGNEENSAEIVRSSLFRSEIFYDGTESSDVYFDALPLEKKQTVKSDYEEEDVEEPEGVYFCAFDERLQRTPPPTANYTQRWGKEKQEKPAESRLDSVLDQRTKSTNEEENGEESMDVFDVFDDSLESLQQTASPTGRETCRDLFHLLDTDLEGRIALNESFNSCHH